MSSGYVLLEDGTRFDGDWCGADDHATGEVVFTTGMSGYQESMTDPSFARQLITFTTAHVGNYGVSEAAMESDHIHAAGAIMRAAVDYDDAPSAEQGWLSWLREHGIPGISGVDTRALVRHIRSAGAMRGPSPEPWWLTSRGETSRARSWPAIGGSAAISACA